MARSKTHIESRGLTAVLLKNRKDAVTIARDDFKRIIG
jgi:hypothetical protein